MSVIEAATGRLRRFVAEKARHCRENIIMAAARIKGVLSPVVTPFRRDLSPDVGRFIAHCKWLLSQDCGLAVFGTNSEANSMSAEERMGLLEAIVAAGVTTDRMMPGTGACSINEAAKVSAHATRLRVAGVLMLPPFYYKGVPEEGLFRFFSEVVQRVGDERLRVYLYHIPPVSAVPITHKLVERLLKAYPGQIAGMKDSSDDWPHTKSMIDAFAKEGFDVFSGNEKPLIDNIKSGGAGCISATANINPGKIAETYTKWRTADGEKLQGWINEVRGVMQGYVMIPALKYVVAHYGSDPAWTPVRPPLVETAEAEGKDMIAKLDKLGFTMPGLKQAMAVAAE
jgi:4-hydroxy-tetrahydrodipicolinate synthase